MWYLQQSWFVIVKGSPAVPPYDDGAYAAFGRLITWDQVIDRATALGLQADVWRNHVIAGWVVMRDQPKPGAFIARLVTDTPTPYVLTADSLAGIHDQLPPGLVRWDRQPVEPPDLVEIWLVV